MPTTLLLLRHGATAANVAQPYTLQGSQPDSELVDAGIIQAKAAADLLASYPAVQVYCSPLKRARTTAEIIADRLEVPLQLVDGLVEADVGLWSGLTWSEIERRWPAEHRAFHDDPATHGYLGGENLTQVRDRVLPIIQQVAATHCDRTIVVVAHGVVNRVLLAHWLGLPLRQSRRLPQDNTAINTVEIRDITAKVQTVNAVVHLKRRSDRRTDFLVRPNNGRTDLEVRPTGQRN